MNTSKRMMYDDLFFAPCVVGLGMWSIAESHYIGGGFLVVLGALWLGARIYHLFHQDEVFSKDV